MSTSIALSAAIIPKLPFDAGAELGNSLNGDPVAGSPAPLVSSTAAVPEPSSLVLLVVGGLVVAQAALRAFGDSELEES